MVRLPALPLVLLVTALALAGCASDDPEEGTTTSSTTTSSRQQDPDPCPTVNDATVVPGWTKNGGQWGPVADLDGHTTVVCGKATSSLNSLVDTLSGPAENLELNVTFVMLDGDHGLSDDELDSADAGAGVVLHFVDTGNYTIVRYSPREQGWHVFTVVDGNRQKQNEGTVAGSTTNPEYGQWVSLRVRSVDGHLEAWDGTTKVIDYMLPAQAAQSGLVGYFLRDAGMVAAWDNFAVAEQ